MPDPTRLVVVADDLTGAADSAASLVGRGPTAVVWDLDGAWPDAAVLAVDTDTRHCDAATAAARVAAVAARALDAGAGVVKKIDSTLRGHLVAELGAMADVLAERGERPLLVVVPAFPATGRTTVGGVVHLDGERLAAHGSDGDVVALLTTGGLRTGLVTPAPTDPAALADRLEAMPDLDAVVVDARDDEHLACVVAATRLVRRPVLLAGSGGLTRPLGTSPGPASADPPRGPTLAVVGSYAETSRRQRSRLTEEGLTLVAPGDSDGLHEALRGAAAAVLSPDPDAPVRRDQALDVARSLAVTAAAVLADVGTLVVTGGETARAVLSEAGVSRLVVTGEVEPGVVRGRVPELDLTVITKAGAFGDPDTLLRCLGTTARPHQEERTP